MGLLSRQSEGLPFQTLAETEALLDQLVQNRIDPGQQSYAFGTYQDSDRSNDLQSHATGQIAGSSIVQDDSVLTLRGKRDRLGFSVVDLHLESRDEGVIGGSLNAQPRC